jgi:hypothetical protein
MKVSIKLLAILALSIIAFTLNACNKKKDIKMTSEVSTDIKELSKFINLPYQPKAVWWQITRQGTPSLIVSFGPTDWIVDAVLLFDKEDLEAILNKSKQNIEPVYSPEQKAIIEKYEKFETIAPKSPEVIAYEGTLHNLLKEHGELEDKTYKPTLFTYRDGRVVRIKGTNKLYVTYQTR